MLFFFFFIFEMYTCIAWGLRALESQQTIEDKKKIKLLMEFRFHPSTTAAKAAR